MSWNSLQEHARSLGLEIALSTRRDHGGGLMPDLKPPAGKGWVLVGNLDHIAGFWVKPVSVAARRLDGELLRKLMAEADPFLEAGGDRASSFLPANVRFIAALKRQQESAADL